MTDEAAFVRPAGLHPACIDNTERDTVYAFILEQSLRRYKKLECQELEDHYEFFSSTNYIMENS